MCLVRTSEDFAHSMLTLSEARNVTYKASWPRAACSKCGRGQEDRGGLQQFVAGPRGDQEMVKAHLTLRHWNLADDDPSLADLDCRLIEAARRQVNLLQLSA